MAVAATGGAPAAGAPPAAPPDPVALLLSPQYLRLLLVAAVLGVPVSAFAYWFLVLVGELQKWLLRDLPGGLGFSTVPSWWPIPVLAVGGLVVGLAIRYAPGHGGESPADGFKAGAVATPSTLPGIALASVATLGFGAV